MIRLWRLLLAVFRGWSSGFPMVLWLNGHDGVLVVDPTSGDFALASGGRSAFGRGRVAFERACRRLDVLLPDAKLPAVLR